MGAADRGHATARLPPFTVHGARLHGIRYELPVASAQVKSCVLLAGLARRGRRRRSSSRSRAATTPSACSRRQRADRRATATRSTVAQRRRARAARGLRGPRRPVVGRVPDRRRRARRRLAADDHGCGVNWTRTGFLRILERMGGDRARRPRAARRATRSRRASRSATSTCAAARSSGTVVEPDEVPLAIDELPLVALLGCFADGETVVRGARELRAQGVRPDRGGRRRPARRSAATSRRPTTASSSAATGGLRGGPIDSRGDHRHGDARRGRRARLARGRRGRRDGGRGGLLPGLPRRSRLAAMM